MRNKSDNGAVPMVLQDLTYAPLPWDTHPIDLAPNQPQGWGPFSGPWMPFDFPDVSQTRAGGIDPYWTQGDNVAVVDYGPGYNELTLFDDHSNDWVANSSFGAVLAEAAEAVHEATASTISQAPPAVLSGFRRMLNNLGINQGG